MKIYLLPRVQFKDQDYDLQLNNFHKLLKKKMKPFNKLKII